ncbi:YgaP family membrane protein [Oryzomicrobium sp.]|uniref:YgaP family membrane protein n=1 Tax=Oryzomicrobium sp. TaxID=1911578 RepID=UPI002FE03A24
MTVERAIRFFAGLMILISLALGAPASPLYVSSYFLWLTAFVGANLFQFSLSNFCPLALVLRKCGVPDGQACGASAQTPRQS